MAIVVSPPVSLYVNIDNNDDITMSKDSELIPTTSLPPTSHIDLCIDIDNQNDAYISKDSETFTTKLIRPPGMLNISWCWHQSYKYPSRRTPSPDNGREILMEDIGKHNHMNDAEL